MARSALGNNVNMGANAPAGFALHNSNGAHVLHGGGHISHINLVANAPAGFALYPDNGAHVIHGGGHIGDINLGGNAPAGFALNHDNGAHVIHGAAHIGDRLHDPLDDHTATIRIMKDITCTIILRGDYHIQFKIILEQNAHLVTTQEVLNQFQWDIDALSITPRDDGLLDCANIGGHAVELSDIN